MKVDIGQIYHSLVNPKPEINNLILQLRSIMSIDINRYRHLKVQLPYLVTGIFTPPVRKTDNFSSIEHLIIDIDHLSEKEISVGSLKEKLKSDKRIELMFASPGNDGLKIFFRLSEKCYDHGKYSIFYRVFARSFSVQYGLEQVIDIATSDVTRACFISVDPDAYCNPECEKIRISDFVNFENLLEVKELQNEIKKASEKTKEIEPEIPSDKPELSEGLLDEIKQKLNPKFKSQREKIIFVPEELDKIVHAIKNKIAEYSIIIKSVGNIHYGKKFVFELENKWAEINVFYGKKGVSVVKTPKRGSDQKLTDIVYQVLCEMFF